jgi:hypothetical protein
MSVYDPIIELRFKHTGTQNAGAEWVSSDVYETAPDEVLEIFRLELIPPVNSDTGIIQKLKYVTLMIDGKEYEPLRINSVMCPVESQTYVTRAIDLGIPYLHRPLTGIIPTSIEGTCPKVARGQPLAIKTVAEDTITGDYQIILKAARIKGAGKLVEVVGTPVVDATFYLNGETYSKSVPVSLETFDELPGGLRQSKPQIFPWFTYARNSQATTVNQWYDFEYYSKVESMWMDLSWNLVNKEAAYLVNYFGVIPHANSKSARFYIEGRITNPEFYIRPLPELNFFPPAMYYDMSVNNSINWAGPRKLIKPFLFHGVKGGIQVIDNGTQIPQNGVELHVYGVKFVLR